LGRQASNLNKGARLSTKNNFFVDRTVMILDKWDFVSD
jgi:hypothetical protein